MCPPTEPPTRSADNHGSDDEDLGRRLFEEAARVPSEVQRIDPIKLIYQSEARFDLNTPCRYQLQLPIKLPSILSPDVPPPPYYPPPGTTCDGVGIYRDIHMSVLRPLLAGALRELLGPHAPVDLMVSDAHLEEEYDGVMIKDKETNFNLETGYWKDQYGNEGHGVDAYWIMGDRIFVIQYFEFHVNWCIGDDDVDPTIVKLKAKEDLEDGKVVFDVSEFPEWLRKCYNGRIQRFGRWV